MNKQDILASIEIESSQPAKYSVIWMHGLGADGNDFAPVGTELKARSHSDIRFVFPHAPVMPVTINNGYEMRAWYDILNFSFDTRADHDGILKSAAQIENLIAREMERGIATDNIFLAGFSQGAVMALTTGICYPKPLAGIIALSGYLPAPEEIRKNATKSNQHIPIFLAHGTEDPILPYSLGLKTHTFLTEAGYPVDWHSYDMPHSVCNEEINDLDNWMKSIKNQ
jgi:phospholipase/carboxylesterase